MIVHGHLLIDPVRRPTLGWVEVDGARISALGEGEPPSRADLGGAQKNAWAKGDTFDGMVYKFRKAAAEVEIQFHTPQSAIIKDQSHVLYTKGRSLPNGPEKTALSTQIKALWNTDRGHVPPNMLDVGDTTAYELDF